MSTSKDPQESASNVPVGDDDLSGFSNFSRSAGTLPVVAALAVAVVFSAAVLWWVFLR